MSEIESAELMLIRDDDGTEHVVVTQAPQRTFATRELLADWAAGNHPHIAIVDRDTYRFGTESKGCGVVTYRLAAAQALRDYADRHHHAGDGHGPISTPGGWIDAASYCVCGAEQGEDGCIEREQLHADADAIERGEQPQTTEQIIAEAAKETP